MVSLSITEGHRRSSLQSCMLDWWQLTTRAKKLTTAMSSFTVEAELEQPQHELHVFAGGEFPHSSSDKCEWG
jgi:hypothetical protein